MDGLIGSNALLSYGNPLSLCYIIAVAKIVTGAQNGEPDKWDFKAVKLALP